MEIANCVKEFSPAHATQLQYLLDWGMKSQIKAENVRRGYPGSRYADRLSILIPFCLDHSKWDFVFNSEYPGNAPDIIFPAEDEKFQAFLLANDTKMNSQSFWSILREWNVKDAAKLKKLVVELRSLYLQYHRTLVEQVDDERLRFEIGTLSSLQGLEMCLVKMSDKQSEEVKFAVPVLQVDCDLVSGRREALIHLKVTFPVRKEELSWSPTVPELKLFVPPVMKELFDVDDVKLPAWSDGMCIAEYIPMLKETLKWQVNEAFSSVHLRKNFIEELQIPFGHPLEADTVCGRNVSILTSSGVFIFLVHFALPIQFPRQQPIIMLQSCLHFDNVGKPITRSYKDYPWSPRWDTAQMVQRIYEFVGDEVLNFKKYCNDILQHLR